MAYLTPGLKEYYLKDLEKNIDYLDEGVLEHIEKINESNGLQTIFSRRPDLTTNPSDKESYLYIAYTKEMEETLKKKLLNVLDLLPDNLNNKSLSSMSGYIQPDIDIHSNQGYKNNPNFFNLAYLAIRMNSELSDNHVTFWKGLSQILSP
jgi:hypothetical protein